MLFSEKIEKIAYCLKRNEDQYINAGISDGLLGIGLFHYYYYKYTNRKKVLQKIPHFIEKAIESLNGEYKGFSLLKDMCDLFSFCNFLEGEGVLSDGTSDIINVYDKTISGLLEIKMERGELDPTNGAILIGRYLTESIEYRKINGKLIDLILSLQKLAHLHPESGGIYWEFNFRNKKKYTELGIMHGMMGVVNFLFRAFEKNVLPDLTLSLIERAIKFVLHFNTHEGINFFPIAAFNSTKYGYQNLCYGDVGIGYSLLAVSAHLNIDDLKNKALDILINTTYFTDENKDYIKDATLLYGASGLFSIYKSLYNKTNASDFQNASKYWLNKILCFNNNKTNWAGYSSYYNSNENYTQISFSEGIVGIGIALINEDLDLNFGYLRFLNYPLI